MEPKENIELLQENTQNSKSAIPFKKPQLLIGKVGRLPKKPTISAVEENKNEPEKTEDTSLDAAKSSKEQCPYKEPPWSGLPIPSGKPYQLEVLKNGSIIETIDLMNKSYSVIGRLPHCDISMQHPTISRFHSVIQYKPIGTNEEPKGFYIYDLGSTHGTFLNGKNNKLKPNMYVPLRVGHMMRMGYSQRQFILTGPEEDQEEESPHSITELKRLRAEKIREEEEQCRLLALEEERMRTKEEERGVDWGICDDANNDDETFENPYASTTNEELYVDDPKKCLRGFFEREGLDLDYDCTDQGMGQFLCKVELPLDDERGCPLVAEVLHKGKKKEAVEQCALEACRILDRAGLLRQAKHESRKRKKKDWEENDYYDSDEDTFLDRTGTIEKKREKRMQMKLTNKLETFETLTKKNNELTETIKNLEIKLTNVQQKSQDSKIQVLDDDPLDSFMKNLQDNKPDKQTTSKLRLELTNLKKEHIQIQKLLKLAEPVDFPSDSMKFGRCLNEEITTTPKYKIAELEQNKSPEEDELPKSHSETVILKNDGREVERLSMENKEILNKVEELSENNEQALKIAERIGEKLENATKQINNEMETIKRKLKNERRTEQRKQKAELDKQRGYLEDSTKEDYNMWMPPKDQTGDGRTKLNDKFGY